MQPVTTTPVPTTTPAPATPDVAPRAGGGIQGVIGDALRSAGAGYAQATRMSAVQADKAAIHPFETVSTATGLLKAKTAGIKGVGTATGLLHTIGGFAMLILTANASGILRSPGVTGSEIANTLADAIDGKQTAQGFTPGWYMALPEQGNGGEQPQPAPSSGIGASLAALGMK